MSAEHLTRRQRFTPAAIGAGIAGTLAISLSLGASLSGFVATITNNNNTAATATLAIQEVGTTGATGTCNSYDSTTACSSINKYGGTATPLVPGGSQTVTVTFTNQGSINATTATLSPAACIATAGALTGTQTPTTPNTTAGNLCSVINIAVYSGATATGTPLYNGSAAAFTAPVTLTALAAGANKAYTFVTSLPTGATTAVQGQQISQNLAWTFNQ